MSVFSIGADSIMIAPVPGNNSYKATTYPWYVRLRDSMIACPPSDGMFSIGDDSIIIAPVPGSDSYRLEPTQ